MLRRGLILGLSLALLAGPALASGGGEGGEKKTEAGQYVDLSPVAIPIVAQGKLVNYVFVYIRINLTGGANAAKLREKEPFFRDALVRASHRTSLAAATDYMHVDEAKLKAALLNEARAIAGPRDIQSVVVTSQTPKKRSGVPLPPKAAART